MAHYIRALRLRRDEVKSFAEYPFSIPAIQHLDRLELDAGVTFFIGENGAGKSTLIEALAVKWGFNAEGGSQNFHYSTRESHSILSRYITLERNPNLRPDGYFLRAESFYTLATEIDNIDERDPGMLHSYGAKSLHEQSHGEAFLALLLHRINNDGLYIFDEPESALSPQRQLSLLVLMHRLVKQGAQLVIATHSPILMAYPGALIYEISSKGIVRTPYEETEHYQITRNFLNRKDQMLAQLLRDE
jgi:predicted ATPase